MTQASPSRPLCSRRQLYPRRTAGFLSIVLLTGAISLSALPVRAQEKQVDQEGAGSKAGDAAAAPAKLPQGVLARVNGRDVTIQEYSDYLLDFYGKKKLWDLVDRILVEEESRRLSIAVTPEEVDQGVQEDIDQKVRVLHQGDLQKFENFLRRRHSVTLDEYRENQRQAKAYELLRDRCIVSARVITDKEIQAEFEKRYGEGGVQYELRHVLVSTRPSALRARRELKSPLSDKAAREKADKIREEAVQGAEFVDLVKKYSDDPLTKRNDGRIPVFRKNIYGPEFNKAVEALSPENRLSPVVRSNRGYHIVEFVRKTETPLEDKREEVVEFLKTRRPGAAERQRYTRKLRELSQVKM